MPQLDFSVFFFEILWFFSFFFLFVPWSGLHLLGPVSEVLFLRWFFILLQSFDFLKRIFFLTANFSIFSSLNSFFNFIKSNFLVSINLLFSKSYSFFLEFGSKRENYYGFLNSFFFTIFATAINSELQWFEVHLDNFFFFL